MNHKYELGKEGEFQAAKFLEQKGYIVLEQNYRYSFLEIDIISKLGNKLVFVEVKTRSNNDRFGHPEQAVDYHKSKRIIECADHYIYEKKWFGDVRFDVISINKVDDNQFKIHHFEDAFY